MSKTFYGHSIHNIKGTDYVEFEDYIELHHRLMKILNYADFIGKCNINDEYVDLFIKDLMEHIKNMILSDGR